MLGLNNSIQSIRKAVPEWLGSFKSRVLADAGSLENNGCIKSDVQGLKIIERTSYILSQLQSDVSSEGGVIESYACLETNIENLHTIL